MPENQILFIIVMAAACFLTGLSKGGLGGMMGAVITSMMALFMPAELAIGLLLPILILGDIFALAAHWRRWETRLVVILLMGAIIGVTLGTLVLTNISTTALRRGLGIIILLFVVYKLLEGRILASIQYQPRIWHGVLAGSISAFTSTLAHAGGPAITIYMLMQKVAPATFVATAVLFLSVLNWIKVPYYWYAGLFNFEILLRVIWLAPLVPLGVWTGKYLVDRIDRVWFERVVVSFLFISGMLLLFR
jgi:uncharacterized membrane protein YfcA